MVAPSRQDFHAERKTMVEHEGCYLGIVSAVRVC